MSKKPFRRTPTLDRRQFLGAAAALPVAALAARALSANAYAAAGETPLRVALIGSGWYGKTDLFHLMQVAPVEVVGLCDVDRQMLDRAAKLVAARQPSKKQPPLFADYRELLQKQSPEIVLVATPDHWHALPMIEACRAGADVYCQKPISRDVAEGQAMVAAARKFGRTVQVGLQRRSTPHLLEARDRFVDAGKLGKVAYAEVHSYFHARTSFPAPTDPPPHLDWQTYVGPAPFQPYRPEIHPRSWRDLSAFSNGQIGDLCVHYFDFLRYVLKLGWPRRITASGGILMRDPQAGPDLQDTQTAVFEYPDMQVVWTQRSWGDPPPGESPWGATIFGDKGTLKLSVWSYEFIPHGEGETVRADHLDEKDKYPADVEYKETELFAAPATRRHMQDFLAARREARRPVCDIEEGYISTACCILGNLSMELGRTLAWDPAAGQVIDDDEANARLVRPYREPWVHPSSETT